MSKSSAGSASPCLSARSTPSYTSSSSSSSLAYGSKSVKPGMRPKPTNVFSNDGSFLERFQKIKREEEERKKIEEDARRKLQFEDRFRKRGKRPHPESTISSDDHDFKKLKLSAFEEVHSKLLGFEVDAVNTVNFSNHTGYGRVGGSKMSADDISSIFSVMEQNGLLIPTRLLTGASLVTCPPSAVSPTEFLIGYVPGADALREVSKLVKKMRSRFPNLIYLLDPVMGDEGEMYVSEDVIPIYRELLPLSTIITPNYFEVEVLTKISLDSLSSLREALRILHEEYKVPNVVISSIPLSGALLSARSHWSQDKIDQDMQQNNFLLCIASAASQTGISTVHTMLIPQLKGYFVGVGDFFSAMVLGQFRETVSGEPPILAHAVANACRITYALLLRTNNHVLTHPEVHGDELDASDIERRVRQMRGRELRIVQERELIIKHDTTKHLLGGDMEEWNNFWES